MSRRDRRISGSERVQTLLEAGNHRAARTIARSVLADPASGDEDRSVAAAAIASLAPERAAVLAGAAGLAAAVALTVLLLLGG